MPFIEPVSGDVSHAVAGAPACLNNKAFGFGGVGGWADGRRIVFGNGDDDWYCSTYDKISGEKKRVNFGGTEVAANLAYGGGGHIACWRGSNDDTRGLYSTVGLRIMDGGLMGMGPDASLAYKPLYHSNGPTNVRELNGDDWQITPGHASALQLLGSRRGIWMEGFTVQVVNIPQPQYVNEGGIWAAKAAFAGGEWWTAYYSGNRGLILHPFKSSKFSYSILPKGDVWHSICAMGPNIVRMTNAKSPSETVGDIWGYDINVLTGEAIPLPFWPEGKPTTFPFVPTDSINKPEVVIPTFSFNHKVMIAPFKDPQGETPAPAEILVNQNIQTATRPLFIADDSVIEGNWKGKLLGIYTEAKGEALAKVIKTAAAMETRVLVCHDSQAPWTLPAGLRKWDIPMVQLYRYKVPVEETLTQAHDRWRLDVQTMLSTWPGDCAIDPQYYCMGGAKDAVPPAPPELWPVEDVLDIQRFLSEMVNKSSRIKVISPFSYLRANGIKPHIEFQQSFSNLLAAAPEVPLLIPVDPPKPIPPDPLPPSPFLHHKGVSVQQLADGAKVRLRGVKGLLLRPDAPNTGMWKAAQPPGWRGGIWDGTADDDARCHYTAKKVGKYYTFTNISENCLAGEDAGWYSTAVDQQLYHKPSGNTDAGDLEQFRVYDGNDNGAWMAVCEHTTDKNHPSGAGKKFWAYPLCVELV